MDLTSTVWTLLPPVIAIALALITKEVYSSLLNGILSGALLLTGFNPLHAVETTFEVMGKMCIRDRTAREAAMLWKKLRVSRRRA